MRSKKTFEVWRLTNSEWETIYVSRKKKKALKFLKKSAFDPIATNQWRLIETGSEGYGLKILYEITRSPVSDEEKPFSPKKADEENPEADLQYCGQGDGSL